MHALAIALALVVSAPTAAPAPGPGKITIDVMDADIVNVLRLFADVSGKNFVVDDDVKGKVTMKLKNVPWEQALKVVCQSKDLGMKKNGNIVRVAPQAELDAEELRRLDGYTAYAEKGPLVTRMILVNNARASELLPHVKSLLSKRGTASVDERTNTIIVRDVRSSAALSY